MVFMNKNKRKRIILFRLHMHLQFHRTVYIRPQRYTREFVDNSDYFSLTFFEGYKKELGILGSKSGRDCDKIKETNFDLEMLDGQPSFKQGKMTFICKSCHCICNPIF